MEKICARCQQIVPESHVCQDTRNKQRHPYHWTKVRLIKLAKDMWCEDCLKADKVTPAVDVHHIVKPSTALTETQKTVLTR